MRVTKLLPTLRVVCLWFEAEKIGVMCLSRAEGTWCTHLIGRPYTHTALTLARTLQSPSHYTHRPCRTHCGALCRHGSVMDRKFNKAYFEQFDIVLNALDNIAARRHVNRMCLAALVPLIESGTKGFLGQCDYIMKDSENEIC